MNPGIAALIMLLVFILLIILEVPIGFSLGISGVLGLVLMKESFLMFPQNLIAGINNFALLAIPFFILLGSLAEKSLLAETLIDLAEEIIGFVPGGMAAVTVFASMLFATASGSGPATVAAIGSITIPEMEKRGYSSKFAIGTAASAGALGPIIPPSIPLIIYGVVANQSITKLFLAGLGAGLLFAFMLTLYCIVRAKIDKVPVTGKKPSAKKILQALWKAKLALGIPIIVLGGIYSGVFTPTESGAIGCLYVIMVGFLIRTLSLKDLYDATLSAAKASAMIMFVIAAAALFAWLMAIGRVPQIAAKAILSFSHNKVVYLMFVNILFLAIGSVLDTPAAIVIMVPILAPIAYRFGIDPIHFGAVVVVNFVIGYITAPFGYNLFVAQSITGKSMEEVTAAVTPFLIICILGLIIITYVPQITLFFPGLLGR